MEFQWKGKWACLRISDLPALQRVCPHVRISLVAPTPCLMSPVVVLTCFRAYVFLYGCFHFFYIARSEVLHKMLGLGHELHFVSGKMSSSIDVGPRKRVRPREV